VGRVTRKREQTSSDRPGGSASIATWVRAKSTGDAAHAERFGIFVGLWAPTFKALGNAIANSKIDDKL